MSDSKKIDHIRDHLSALIGATILSVVDDGGKDAHDRAYGLRVKRKDGTLVVAWIMRGPEGNGPGFLDYEDEPLVEVGDKVVAEQTITEVGGHPGGTSSKFPAPRYIHAVEGDVGEVVHVNEEGLPTVRFERTGTATIVGWGEVTPESAS